MVKRRIVSARHHLRSANSLPWSNRALQLGTMCHRLL